MQNGAPGNIPTNWLQRGIVMGVAMRILCFAVLQGNAGIVAPSAQEAGLNALITWDHVQKAAIRVERQATNAYENIRFAYRVARQLKEMEEEPAGQRLRMKFRSLADQCRAENLILDRRDRNPKSGTRVRNVISRCL